MRARRRARHARPRRRARRARSTAAARRARRDRPARVLDAARLDARQAEQIAEQRLDARRRLADAAHEARGLLGLVERAVVEHLGAGADGGDRVLELVREIGGEGLDEGPPLELAAHRVDARATGAAPRARTPAAAARAALALADALGEVGQRLDRLGDGAPDEGGGAAPRRRRAPG